MILKELGEAGTQSGLQHDHLLKSIRRQLVLLEREQRFRHSILISSIKIGQLHIQIPLSMPLKARDPNLPHQSPIKTAPHHTSNTLDQYRSEIGSYLKTRVAQLSRKNEPYDCEKARAMAIDWIIGVADWFELRSRTIGLAVYLMSRAGELMVSPLSLTYITVASLHSACKYEQIAPPSIESLMERAQHSLQQQQIYHYEKAILQDVDYDLSAALAVDLVVEPDQELSFLIECSYFARRWVDAAQQLEECQKLKARRGGKQVLLSLMYIRAEGLDKLIRKYRRIGQKGVSAWLCD